MSDRMHFIRLTHRQISGERRRIADAALALERAGWEHRSELQSLVPDLKAGRLEKVTAKLTKLAAKQMQPTEAQKLLAACARETLAILRSDIAEVTAYVYVCLNPESVIDSVVEGELVRNSNRAEEVDDLPLDGGTIRSCVIIWRNGLMRHVDMNGAAVVAALARGPLFDPKEAS